jgi:penicillin-binding protein 1C
LSEPPWWFSVWRRQRALSAAASAFAVSIAAAWYVRCGPLPAGFLDFRDGASIEIVDRNGERLYEARAGDGSRSSWLAPDRLPRSLVDATIAAEDHRFFSHVGIDPIGIGRAALRNLRHLRWLEGGSTITQQSVKLLLARRERTARRGVAAKLREAVLALRLEHRLSKQSILALYLNLAPYGNQLAGADRASRAYFGHEAALLTPAQAAFLASLPQRPSTYNPYRDQRRARARQERVIVLMGVHELLDPVAVRAALDERLVLVPEQPAFVAPHFVERALAIARHAEAISDHSIRTTLDANLQRTVSGIVRAARPALERHGAHNVAAVVLDNATGEWLAWEGSGNYDDAEHGGKIDGVISPRQPGSALKPFTYALAFENGESPATVLPDVPSFYPTAREGIVYEPRNYDNHFRGPLLARRALAGSANVPAVALASRVGVANLLRFLRSAGLTTFDKTAAYYGLGLTLGDAEVRLDELVAAYSAFARGGTFIQPTMLRRPTPPVPHALVSERTAFWITDILSDDEARAYAFGRGGSLEFPFSVAAKTGTSQAYHDNWVIGYTRDVTVGVWVGNFDRKPLESSSGITGAGPIFHAIMLAAAGGSARSRAGEAANATIARPAGLTRRAICALSGLPAARDCPSQIDEWIDNESARRTCSWHRQSADRVVVDWPIEYRVWAASERLVAPDSASRTAPQLRVVSPPDGAVYLIDPTLRREFQTIGLRGASPSRTQLEWRVDGQPVGTIESDSSLDWPLSPGKHVVSAHAVNGQTARAEILVR